MNLTQLIQFDLIQFGFTAKDKKDALATMLTPPKKQVQTQSQQLVRA